jgi:hypothetical protein
MVVDLNSKLDLRGGKFVNQGADSCIYMDGPVGCVPGTLVVEDPSYNVNDKSLVSRIIPKTDREFTNQAEVRKAIERLDIKYQGLRFKEHFNVAIATCTPLFTEKDLQSDLEPKYCTVKSNKKMNLNTIGAKNEYINFLTKRQDATLEQYIKEPKLSKTYFRKAFFETMNTVVALNCENVLHYDLHSGNIAWTMDPFPQKTLVLFDWGRCVLGYKQFLKTLGEDKYLMDPKENYSQFNYQRQIINIIIGNETLKEYIKKNTELKDKYLTQLEKLFFAWDTYSMLHFLSKKKFSGMEDFSLEKVGRGKKHISGKYAKQLINQAVSVINFPRIKNHVKGSTLFRDYMWGIIAQVFKQKPVYKDGNLYVSTFVRNNVPNRLSDRFLTLKNSVSLSQVETVLAIFKKVCIQNDGCTIEQVAKFAKKLPSLKNITLQQISEITEELEQEGYIYSTINNKTFKAAVLEPIANSSLPSEIFLSRSRLTSSRSKGSTLLRSKSKSRSRSNSRSIIDLVSTSRSKSKSKSKSRSNHQKSFLARLARLRSKSKSKSRLRSSSRSDFDY